jgi:hypothetical protein
MSATATPEMRGVMGEAAGCPELAVADAIDTSFDLPLHRLRNGWCDGIVKATGSSCGRFIG